MNLYLNGAILIFVRLCLYFYSFRGIGQKVRDKKQHTTVQRTGHLQIVNSFLIVQQAKQHKAPQIGM